jgi:hypothetical protein
MPGKAARFLRYFPPGFHHIESLESRRMLDGTLPQGLLAIYSYAQNNFQSILIDITFSPAGPPTVNAGQTLTIETTSTKDINLFCSDSESAVSIDGNTTNGTMPTSVSTYDYLTAQIQPDPGISVPLGPGEHTVVFTLLDTDSTESVSAASNGNGGTPLFSGPWVVANGNDSGSIFSSPLPFAITGENHLAFVQQPTNTSGANVSITPPMTVAVEDANNAIVDDNFSSITLAPETVGGLAPGFLNGVTTVTTVDGIATFSGVSVMIVGNFTMVAAAGGFADVSGGQDESESLEPVGLFATSNSFTVGSSNGGGGGSTSSTLTVGLTKSTLPPSVVAGGTSHGTAIVSVANSGTSTESSTATVSVYASTDGSIDDTATLLGSLPPRRLTLKPGRATEVSVPIRSIPAALVGSYTLLAQVTDASGSSSASSTGPGLDSAAPLITFSETIIKTTLPPSDVSGQETRATIQLHVTNLGNIVSKGLSTVALFASPDQTATDGTPIRSLPESIVLKPGASRTIPLKLLAIPAVSNGPYFIVAQVTDPQADITTTATPGTFTLAKPFIAFAFAGATTVIPNHGKGPANVLFSLTNNGNIPSTGTSTVNLFISSNGVTTGAAVFTKALSLIVQPNKTRLFHLSVPVAPTAALAAATQVMIQVIDPLGDVQMEVLPF